MTDKTLYFKALHISQVKCFKDAYDIRFTDNQDKPTQWTVIIGNNNTGKTTLLKALAGLEPEQVHSLNAESDPKGRSYKYLYAPTGFFYKLEIFGESENYKKEESLISADFSFPISRYGKIDYSYGSFKMGMTDDKNIVSNLIIYCYGTSRRSSSTNSLSGKTAKGAIEDLINDKTELINTEEWLLQTDYAIKNGSKLAQKIFETIQDIFLRSYILPDIKNIRFETDDKLQSFVEVETIYGWVRMSALGYGYQITIAWLADLAKRMFDRYPELENPLHGPAIVLVDEIDLHLHPEWQRKIIKYLSDLFPNTQFIVTAHSPIVVQSAENINLVMLEKDEETGGVSIRQQFGSFQGWTVEEILRELMDLGEKTRSDRYLELMQQFEDALLEENYAGAKAAYDELDKILSPSSHQRKVLEIQMSSLIPA